MFKKKKKKNCNEREKRLWVYEDDVLRKNSKSPLPKVMIIVPSRLEMSIIIKIMLQMGLCVIFVQEGSVE